MLLRSRVWWSAIVISYRKTYREKTSTFIVRNVSKCIATKTQSHHHHHHQNITTKTTPQKHYHKKHHYKITTTKNTTTKTRPQEHHHINTTTKKKTVQNQHHKVLAGLLPHDPTTAIRLTSTVNFQSNLADTAILNGTTSTGPFFTKIHQRVDLVTTLLLSSNFNRIQASQTTSHFPTN